MKIEDKISQLIGQGAQAAAASAQTHAVKVMAETLYQLGAQHGAAQAEIRRLQGELERAHATEEQLRAELGEAVEEEAVEDTQLQRADEQVAAKIGGRYRVEV